ncbi:MAG: glucose-1-phosphate adenylyltransferase [Endomicrobiales bacterium]
MKTQETRSVMSNKTVALILGGGRGSRLYPLTKSRCKPAVAVGGKYRLIDIPISNCINSGISMIYVLTQFLSAGLNRHITRTYRFDTFGSRFVEILAAEQSPTNYDYAQGTADAVRQSIRYLEGLDADYVFILSGDQLFRIDLNKILEQHIAQNADVTLSCLRISDDDASKSGIIRINEEKRIVDFYEKPEDPQIIERFRLSQSHDDGKNILGSMGLYLFNKSVLLDVLKSSDKHDFGKGIFPQIISTHRVAAYEFNGYWEDIGTILSYFNTSMQLVSENPPFSFYDPAMPIYTHQRALPPPQVFDSYVDKSIICEGSIVHGSSIRRTIVGIRTHIQSGCDIDEAVIMGNDAYPSDTSVAGFSPAANHGIEQGVKIHKAIIDKNVVIGKGSCITGSSDETICVKSDDRSPFHIINGIVVIPRGTHLPDNSIITADNYAHAGTANKRA